MDKKVGLWAFLAVAVLIVAMAWATWSGYADATGRESTVYGSTWFTLLWVVAATAGCYYVLVASLHRRMAVFMLHLSFLLILTGALTTRLTGISGQLHLRENEPVDGFFDEWTHRRITFPFEMTLKSFEIEYYPGTNSPADYVSVVALTGVSGNDGDVPMERRIAMNNILKYRGYRFYQASFDEDLHGSILSVNRDTWGIAISYAGYFVMFVAMLLVLLSRRERFRFLLRKLARKTVFFAGLLFAAPFASSASPLLHPDTLSLSREYADVLGRVLVEYQGRACPLQTVAGDFTAKLTGKATWGDFTAEQVFFGWLFFPERWQYQPVFELHSAELKRMAGVDGTYASLADFTGPEGHNVLDAYHHQLYGSAQPAGWLKEAVKLNDRFLLIRMLQNGSLLKIFPMHDATGRLRWYSPNSGIPMQADSMENVFARHFFPLCYDAVLQNDASAVTLYAEKMQAFQKKKAGEMLPSDFRLWMERFYNRLHIFPLLFKICLTLGGLCLLYFIFYTIIRDLRTASGQICSPVHRFQRIEKLLYIALWAVFIAATAGLGLRTCIGWRIPMSNSYETMLLLAWLSLLTGILARRYSFLIVIFSFLLSGFTLLVAHIGAMNPQITPLMPVLQSPLLSIHVLTIMTAYGLCGFMALNSLTALIVWIFSGKKANRTVYILHMKETSELFMYPATFLMGAGIFIGAIWANISWGRYWGWDPKEVWALITFLLMGFTFHGRSLAWFRRPLFYHLFVLLIFLAVLMTYFGVNYILGGKHSYAG